MEACWYCLTGHFQLSHYLESFPLLFFHYIDNLGGGGPPSSHRQISYWLSKDYCHDNNRSTLAPNTIKDKNHSKATLSLPPLCPHHYFSTSWSRCSSHTSWINNKIQGRCLGGGRLLSTNVKLEFRNVERILWIKFYQNKRWNNLVLFLCYFIIFPFSILKMRKLGSRQNEQEEKTLYVSLGPWGMTQDLSDP